MFIYSYHMFLEKIQSMHPYSDHNHEVDAVPFAASTFAALLFNQLR